MQLCLLPIVVITITRMSLAPGGPIPEMRPSISAPAGAAYRTARTAVGGCLAACVAARNRGVAEECKMQTTLRKRHSPEEIASKLDQADELSQHGKRQADIARALGVSVMTYHRWRAAARTVEQAPSIMPAILHSLRRSGSQEASRLEDLQVENERLRRLVIDLLLGRGRLTLDQSPLRDR